MVSRCPHSRCSHMFSRSSLRTLWSNWATKVARIFGVRMCAGSWLCPPSGESQPSNSWDRQRRWWVWVVLESAHPTRRSIRRLFRQYVFIGRTNTLSLVWKSRAFKGKRGGKFRLVEAVCFCGKDILLALPADVQKYAFSCPCATILSYFFSPAGRYVYFRQSFSDAYRSGTRSSVCLLPSAAHAPAGARNRDNAASTVIKAVNDRHHDVPSCCD